MLTYEPRNFESFFEGSYYFENKGIYYGPKRFIWFGKPDYLRIKEHARKHPAFNDVPLVIFKNATWRNPEDSFEVIGTYGDENARKRLIKNIAPLFSGMRGGKGGLWCPAQNEDETGFFIGGTRDISMCDRFADYLKQQPTESELKK